ncbi:hypothetical protein BDV06DRAFT_124334 [Aspergillus oleicola]
MDLDDISLDSHDELRHEWIALTSKSSSGICELANRYRGRDGCLMRSMHCGSISAFASTGTIMERTGLFDFHYLGSRCSWMKRYRAKLF